MVEKKLETKEYLGDGVYVKHDGHNIILTTENGISTDNTIYLDLDVIHSLITYIEKYTTKV